MRKILARRLSQSLSSFVKETADKCGKDEYDKTGWQVSYQGEMLSVHWLGVKCQADVGNNNVNCVINDFE